MFSEDDLLPISALQHLLFCERQCALIHIERLWADNRLTVEGTHLHERVHEQDGVEGRGNTRVARGLVLRSFRLGIWGIADVVEFQRSPLEDGSDGAVLHAAWPGRWRVRPVEYKRGMPKDDPCDRVQLGAQALCLEEMLGGVVGEAALFYGAPRRRMNVSVDQALRAAVESAAAELHQLIASGRTPAARYGKKCENCSLVELCLPHLAGRRSAADYLRTVTEED
jgi:CRISPR-associated exonuclease Cas4